MVGQEAVADEINELTAVPALLARVAENNGLYDAIVSIDAIATNATAIKAAGAHYLLAVKASQPILRAEVEACFAAARPGTVDTNVEHDKGHGRIDQHQDCKG